VGDGSKVDWWAVSTPERPDAASQRKVVQAGGLEVVAANLAELEVAPAVRAEAARALWCLVAENPDVAAKAFDGNTRLAHRTVQLLKSAPPVVKAASAGVVGAVCALNDVTGLTHHFVAAGCVEPICLLLACGDIPGKCSAAETLCALSAGYPGEVAAGGAVAPLSQIFSQGLGRAAPARAKAAITLALANLVRHDPKQALFLIRSGAAGPLAQFLADDDDASKGAAAALCGAMAACADAADAVSRSAVPALVLLAGCPACTARTRRDAFLAIGAIGASSRDAAAALVARGALQHVRAYLAAGYTGAHDGSPAVAVAATATLPSVGCSIWGTSLDTDNSVSTHGQMLGQNSGSTGFKGTGLGQRQDQAPGAVGDMRNYTETENGGLAHAALMALAGLAAAIDFSQVDQHGPLTPLLLRCIEVDTSVPVVEAAAVVVQSILALGRGRRDDPRVVLFRAGRSGGEEVSIRQTVLQPLLRGLARALAAPRTAAAPASSEAGVTSMRAAILGALAGLCERNPSHCVLLGALPGTVADISRIAEKAKDSELRVLAAELLCELTRGGGSRLATQAVSLGAALAACQLLEEAADDRAAVAACRLMEALAVGEDNSVAVTCSKPRALLPLLPLLGPQATHNAREAAASLVAQLATTVHVHFLLSRAGVIPPLLHLLKPGSTVAAQGNAMIAVARLAASATLSADTQLSENQYERADRGGVDNSGLPLVRGDGRGLPLDSGRRTTPISGSGGHLQHPMELSVGEYRSSIERQRELALRISAVPSPPPHPQRGLVLVGDTGNANVTEATAGRRQAAVHSDLLQGGVCKLIAELVAPEAGPGATLLLLRAAAGAVAALAGIADYANDVVLLDTLPPMEEALARVEQAAAQGGSAVSTQDMLDAAANPAFHRLLPGEDEDTGDVFRHAIQALQEFSRQVEFRMRHQRL
jgi:hypothetical protein